jgi:hypothetical protein
MGTRCPPQETGVESDHFGCQAFSGQDTATTLSGTLGTDAGRVTSVNVNLVSEVAHDVTLEVDFTLFSGVDRFQWTVVLDVPATRSLVQRVSWPEGARTLLDAATRPVHLRAVTRGEHGAFAMPAIRVGGPDAELQRVYADDGTYTIQPVGAVELTGDLGRFRTERPEMAAEVLP